MTYLHYLLLHHQCVVEGASWKFSCVEESVLGLTTAQGLSVQFPSSSVQRQPPASGSYWMVCVSCPWCTDALLTAGRESSTPTSLCWGNQQTRIPFIVFYSIRVSIIFYVSSLDKLCGPLIYVWSCWNWWKLRRGYLFCLFWVWQVRFISQDVHMQCRMSLCSFKIYETLNT